MNEFPCPDCPVYVMCKSRLSYLNSAQLYSMCPILYNYLFENVDNTETGMVIDRINVARVYFGIPAFHLTGKRKKTNDI